MTISAIDHAYMQDALELAARGRYGVSPNPRVGCVLVRDEQVIGTGWHRRDGEDHAEIIALNACADEQGGAQGATAYVTLEPCAHEGRTGSCAQALVRAGVRRVVGAIEDPFPAVAGQGFALLREAGCDVDVGVGAAQALALNRGFFSRIQRKRPWVTLKIGASLDGNTALANGASQWITDEAARADVHELRACSDVVITGVGTVNADNPRLDARLSDPQVKIEQPRPVVLASSARASYDAVIFHRHALLYTTSGASAEHYRSPPGNSEVVALESTHTDGVPLVQVLLDLGKRGINNAMIEAGPMLSGAFMRADLVDRIVVYQAPRFLGAGARGMLDLGEITDLGDAPSWQLVDVERCGNGTRLVLEKAEL